MTGQAGDLGRYFAEITQRRRVQVTAAVEQIARAKADEAVAVAEIQRQADAAITTAVDSAGDRDGTDSSQRGWPAEQGDPRDTFPAAFLPAAGAEDIDDADDGETWRG